MTSLSRGSPTTSSSSMEASFATLEICEHIRMPTAFHGFSKLPHELQNIIWRFAVSNVANDSLNETRIVIQRGPMRSSNTQVLYARSRHWPAFPEGFTDLFFAAPYRMPSVLRVSSRLRTEALRLLPLPRPLTSSFKGEKRQLYFDFDRDILYYEDIAWFNIHTTGHETVLHWSIAEWEKIRSIRRVALMIADETAHGLLLTSLNNNGRVRQWVNDLLFRLPPNMTRGALKEVLVLIPKSLNYYAEPSMMISKHDLCKCLVQPFHRGYVYAEAQSLENALQKEWSQRMRVMDVQISLNIRYAQFRLPL